MRLSVGDSVTHPDGRTGNVVLVRGDLARAAFVEGETLTGWFSRDTDTRVSPAKRLLCPIGVTIDTSTWTRLPEVEEYASARGITWAEAIRLLVNQGLSHERS